MFDDFIVPCLREDIEIDIITDNNEELAVLTDKKGYAQQPVVIPSYFLKIIELIDGQHTFSELLKAIKAHLKFEIEPSILIDILKEFNNRCYLESSNYYFTKYQLDYYKSLPIRPAVCKGMTYPEQAVELELELNKILSECEVQKTKENTNFVIVPHIDFSIGKIAHEVYAPAYQLIKNSDADLYVIFGTSHYGNSDLFMLSEKDFETPLGIAMTDKEIINDLQKILSEKLTIDELAHRYEHSIELQIILLQYINKGKDFKILPVLTGSFHNFVYKRLQPNKDDSFFNFILSLNEAIKSRNKKPMFIASADFAHIGRKFQDNFDAEPALEQLKLEDANLIDQIVKGDSEAFFNAVAIENDKRRICGLAPIYSLLETQKLYLNNEKLQGKVLKYNQWNEVETRSAVSFASFAFI
jgi:AmmeMemoRadiSam system protein B